MYKSKVCWALLAALGVAVAAWGIGAAEPPAGKGQAEPTEKELKEEKDPVPDRKAVEEFDTEEEKALPHACYTGPVGAFHALGRNVSPSIFVYNNRCYINQVFDWSGSVSFGGKRYNSYKLRGANFWIYIQDVPGDHVHVSVLTRNGNNPAKYYQTALKTNH